MVAPRVVVTSSVDPGFQLTFAASTWRSILSMNKELLLEQIEVCEWIDRN